MNYTPTGHTTFMSARPTNINAPSGYSFTDLGGKNWRFTWKGGRIAREQNYGIYSTGTIVEHQSGFMFVNGVAYDSTTGSPLLQDKYAFYRPSTGSGELAMNANQFSSRGSINTQFPHNGAAPTWNEAFWSALGNDPMVAGFGALGSVFTMLGGFGGGERPTSYRYTDYELNAGWWENANTAFWRPSTFGVAGETTVPEWMQWTSRTFGLISATAFTFATLGTGAVAWGAVAGTWGGAGLGGGIGGAISPETWGNGESLGTYDLVPQGRTSRRQHGRVRPDDRQRQTTGGSRYPGLLRLPWLASRHPLAHWTGLTAGVYDTIL